MDSLKNSACAICAERRVGRARWFLVAEDRWQDKLKILHWDDSLATRAGIRCACTPAHLQQLVVHWMTTGSLDHPFAHRACRQERRARPRRPEPPARESLPASGIRQIGELSVHRESMQRVLSESPQSLQAILDALLSALHRDSPRPEPKIDWDDEALRVVPREV